MITRAKLKQKEYMPPDWFCCPEMEEYYEKSKNEVILVDTSQIDRHTILECSCGHLMRIKGGYKVINEDFYAVIDLYDLEEAPCPSSV